MFRNSFKAGEPVEPLMFLFLILSSLVCTLSSNVYAEAPRVEPTILDSIPHEKVY